MEVNVNRYSRRAVFYLLSYFRYLPFVIEVLLDRPVNEINLIHNLRDNEARFAAKLLSITSN